MKLQYCILVIFIFLFLVSSAFSNVVSDSINSIISNKNQKSEININNSNNNQSRTLEKSHAFDQFNKQYAFVVFYRSSCPHCQRFIPVLYQFKNYFGFHVFAYTTDGGVLAQFPHSMVMTQAIEKTFFSSPEIEVPSLFIINVKTMQAYLIDQGEISFNALENKVNAFFENKGAI